MLTQLLTALSFSILLVFCRVGSAIMLLPGIGEAFVSARIRLLFALAVSAILTPVLMPHLPAAPASPFGLFAVMIQEILIGITLGAACRILISTMHMAGQIMSFQVGLSTATMFDVTQASQGSLIGNFLSVLVVVLIFATNLHHVMLQGLADSYAAFPAGKMPPMGDLVELVTRLMSSSFMVAVKLSAPLIAAAFLVYIGAGVLSRIMPTMQVFFLLMPAQIAVGLYLLMITMSVVALGYIDYLSDTLPGIFGK